MKWRFLKYLMAYSIPVVVNLSFQWDGVWSYVPVLYAFALVPLLEVLLGPNPANLAPQAEQLIREDPIYDRLLYLMVPVQYLTLAYFLWTISYPTDSLTFWGHTTAMGLMCGVIGINVGHELGHRRKKWEQVLAKLLLSSSLYVHFFTEHNYGHHRNVSTPEDPASARYNEPLYFFWFRSIIGSYTHAWQIQSRLLVKKKQSFFSKENDLLIWHLAQALLVFGISLALGWSVTLAFLAAAFIGILLLETVNYIEHYGLSRQKINEHRYEKATPHHSWNSDHVVGRLLLFELSRHSDHHAYPHRKYQILEHHDESPQLPTGYPGMMLLSVIPPLWFRLMNPRVKETVQLSRP